MRQIPAALAAKINDQNQTEGMGNQPRVYATLTNRDYIMSDIYSGPKADMWNAPLDILLPDKSNPGAYKSHDTITSMHISPKRAEGVIFGPPESYYLVCANSRTVEVYILENPDISDKGWVEQDGSPGTDEVRLNVEAKEVEMVFDGDWIRYNDSWKYYTIGDPWILWIDNTNTAWAQHWNRIDTRVQISDTGEVNSVNPRIHGLRAWRADTAVAPELDAGIMVGYTTNSSPSLLKYRAYRQKSDLGYEWIPITTIPLTKPGGWTVSPTQFNNFILFNTNDGRVGAMAATDSGVYRIVSQVYRS